MSIIVLQVSFETSNCFSFLNLSLFTVFNYSIVRKFFSEKPERLVTTTISTIALL